MRSFHKDTFVIFEPHPLANKGLQALIEPLKTQTYSSDCLKGVISILNSDDNKTVIMELYHHNEELYEVMQFVLAAKRAWPKASFVIFTDITNPSILAILASETHVSLVSKRDDLEYLLEAISATRYALCYRSPMMQQILPQQVQPLSHTEWRILRLMIGGASVQRIACATQRSYKTVCTHKLNIMRKLGVNQIGFMLLVLAFRTRYWS
ncbi:DNA-binding NarL/FixJ family response regulator [Serratia fonticola]|jgi:DNA-binding NarL/FixJ family response regulator|uniref:DNA-binding NarL/FixJ family response regulator n=1 Tax=Serratia fonticola TaxID=47917 RepID=A0A542BMI8_SERFO|nr:LuxR C-terminal-related transcriptional regulator [Serratia fonticola]TQI79735.1 DNA-binding NarL/FixJ family response regulator [Serratia fonticola]TQI98239.1 DNA-binding NarL/FixJ family response regulator [Serratia fonticola]TVZ67767.1 DNA-binding NarL/FixJ family response regulator [Serratia fonticola]